MAKTTFRGGAHPPERKSGSAHLQIETYLALKSVTIPVNQHFGAPIAPIVEVGQTVKKGQKIADGQGPMTVPVHASIPGVVKKIEPRLQPSNAEGLAIVIEADGSDATDYLPPLDAFKASKEEALARIREAGIVGMGGAGFPAHVKLSPKPGALIDLVIANGAECEPYLTIDERTMIERANELVTGLAISMHILKCAKGVIAVEDNKANVVEGLEKAIAAKGRGMDIAVRLLKTKYPQGGEKMLITALTGKEVPSGGLPMDVGCVVQNVGTLVAIAEAFEKGKPLVERGFTATGGACVSPKNLVVPIGALVSDLVASGAIGLDEPALRRLVAGGPMMGPAVPSAQIPIQKNTSGVLFMNAAEAKAFEETPCIRCGRCMRACSCRLSPMLMAKALKEDDLAEADRIGVLDCIECGTCSYVCPARIQLVQRFRLGKQLVRAMKQKEKEAKNA